MIRIGVDLVSGESPLEDLVAGCFDALKEYSDFEVYLIGDEEVYKKHLLKYTKAANNKYLDRIKIIHAPDVITMEDDPLTCVKQKKDSSIIRGLQSHKKDEIDAFFSPGNTGAIVVAASIILGRIKGVKKPALAAYMPTVDGNANILLDVGANVNCEVDDYVLFAIMGQIYAKEMLKIENPRIGLLNIGEEGHKGTPLIKSVYKKLNEINMNFIGNVEGRDLFFKVADVIICDGYIGNITLKTAEGAGKAIVELLKNSIKSDLLATLSLPLYMGALKKMKKKMDPEYYGGAPLIGVDGNVFIGHGISGRLAIKQGILAARTAVSNKIVSKINHKLKELKI